MQEATTIKGRYVNLDLLRILAMMGVVMNHVFNYGLHIYESSPQFRTFDVTSMQGSAVWALLEMMKLMVLPSVDCFVLITGYFLIDKTEYRKRGIWKVWSQTWIYAVGIAAIALASGIEPFSWSFAFESLTPVWHNDYWFVTSYLVLMLVAPHLSRMVQGITKRQYTILLIVGFIICFQPLLGQYCINRQNILLFFYLYLVGGYIHRYSNDLHCNRWMLIASYLFLLGIMFGYVLVKNIMVNDQSHFVIYAMAYEGLVMPLAVVCFMIFRRINIPKYFNKAILAIAPLSFAVYIIHTQTTVDHYLWTYASRLLDTANGWELPLYCTIICLAVFLICIFIEQLRLWAVKPFSFTTRKSE